MALSKKKLLDVQAKYGDERRSVIDIVEEILV